MTGPRSRHPDRDPDHRGSGTQFKAGRFAPALLHPGYANICLCYLLVAALLPVPIALYFAVRFSETGDDQLEAHYLYIRTTIALIVIGAAAGTLLVLLGAPLSSALMLGGLGLILGTVLLTLPRCVYGLYQAMRNLPPRNPKSFVI